ncbi:MAG: PrgI family protein [Candidatus Harrisonbacteria bacterium]|nr:PrgI family protein [Candidatus Harrisonbacteria bacterium]
MQFQVPQFIETESKIVGPLTLKQFGWLGGAGLLAFILFFVLKTAVWVIVTVLLGIIAAAFAFGKYQGRPLVTVMKSAVAYLWKPKLYLWKRSEEKPQVQWSQIPKTYPPAGGPVSRLKNLTMTLLTKKQPPAPKPPVGKGYNSK